IGHGDQVGSDFVAINPNANIPARGDYSEQEPISVFESANLLLYLAEKFEAFLEKAWAERTEFLNLLFWQTGAAPFV
ncbi:glutathione-dependent disulfide-bond oxidoreductase, partial [Streptococcus suis]